MNVTQEEFTVLWTRAMPPVFAYVSSLVPSYHDAQDIIQEVAIVLFRRREDYQRDKSFTSWAIGIARIAARAHWRKQQKQDVPWSPEILETLEAECETMAPELTLRLQYLDDCVKTLQLAGRSWDLFSLRYREGLPPRKIAELRGMASGTVRVTLNRIRDALRSCIEQRMGKEATQI